MANRRDWTGCPDCSRLASHQVAWFPGPVRMDRKRSRCPRPGDRGRHVTGLWIPWAGGRCRSRSRIPGASFVFAFRSLPLVVFIGALSAVLYHYRVLPFVVRGFAWVLTKTLRISGAASFSTAANVFIGMVEAPLLVRPYLLTMTRSELFIVMTGGMATIAGTVYALYASFLDGIIPDPAGHLLTASIISAPAAIVIALILVPRTGDESEDAEVEFDQVYENGADALTRGAIDGLRLFAYIIGMLIVLVALVELINIVLGLVPDIADGPLTMQRVLGWLLAPVVWLLGIPMVRGDQCRTTAGNQGRTQRAGRLPADGGASSRQSQRTQFG